MDTTTPPSVTPSSPAAPPAEPPSASANEDKTVAILSYITLIGFIAAIIMHGSKKTQLGAFHLRQTLGLFLTAIALGICQIPIMIIPILGFLCALAAWACLVVFWVMGLLSAIKGETKPMPLLGPLYQKWFGSAFN